MKIKYKKNRRNLTLTTRCFTNNTQVGSCACHQCKNFINDDNKNVVECKINPSIEHLSKKRLWEIIKNT